MQINVRDFGAVGDGETDDTEAIQRAIDAAVSLPEPSVIHFPAGTYIVRATLRSAT